MFINYFHRFSVFLIIVASINILNYIFRTRMQDGRMLDTSSLGRTAIIWKISKKLNLSSVFFRNKIRIFSKFFPHRVPHQILSEMLIANVIGNAQRILLTKEKATDSLQIKKRFDFNWKLYKGKITIEKQINLAV